MHVNIDLMAEYNNFMSIYMYKVYYVRSLRDRTKGKLFLLFSFSIRWLITSILSYTGFYPNIVSVLLFSQISLVFKNTLGVLPTIVNIPYTDEPSFAFKVVHICKINAFVE